MLADLLQRLSVQMTRLVERLTGKPEKKLALPSPPVLKGEPSPEAALDIPMRDLSDEQAARRSAQERGQFMARQERWDELSQAIREAEDAREKTPGGMPVSDLMAFGAREDVVRAAEHALLEGSPPKGTRLLDGIHALEEVLEDNPDDYVISLIVALAHVDHGWAWRGSGHEGDVPQSNRQAFHAHFDRAKAILDPHCGIELNSPGVAAARCALLAADQTADARIADDYEDLIDLDPNNPRHMRAMGNHLLPRWFGSYSQLELEARRTAARTQDIWGAGGYSWVFFDAIAIDDGACAQVDVDFFIDGLKDIVTVRPDQNMVNLLASYCSVAMRTESGKNAAADANRAKIIDCAGWLIRDHLTEVHPLLWAHAAEGFDNASRVTSVQRFEQRGREDALRVIADQFADDIASGLRVTYTPEGPRLTSA